MPKALLLAVLISACVELFFLRMDDHLYEQPLEGLRMKMKNQESLNPSQNYELVIFGDCYAAGGIVSSLLEQRTGLASFNFATGSDQSILVSYAMMRNYFRTVETKPKYVILEFINLTAAATKQYVWKYKMPYLYDVNRGNFDLFWREYGWQETLKLMIPSLKRQHLFKAFMLEGRVPNPTSRRELKEFTREFYENGGAQPMPPDLVYAGTVKDIGRYVIFNTSPFFKKYVKKMLDLAEIHDIPVIYILPSMPPDLYSVRTKYGALRNYMFFLKEIQELYPELKVIHPQEILNRKEWYIDWTHLNGRGADRLSESLAQLILVQMQTNK